MLLFIYGDDTYRSSRKLKEIKEDFKSKTDPSGINLITIEGSDFDLEKFNNASSQQGFLAAARLIVIKNLLSGKPGKNLSEELIQSIKRLKDSDNSYVFWEGGSPDKRTSLFKLLAKDKQKVLEFNFLEYNELANWLKRYLAEHKARMSIPAQQLLLSFTESNLWQLSNEADKLIAYKSGGEITEKDVQEMATAKVYENIFSLTDAIAENDKKRSLELLKEQFQAGLNEQYLLTMIIRQFRLLAQLKPLAKKHYSESRIVEATKLHPFVVKKTLPQARKFTEEKIKTIYGLLIRLDRRLKSTKLSSQTLINLFLVEI